MKPQQSIFNSFRCAVKGIYVAVSTQRNLKLQSICGLVVVGVAGAVQVTLVEWTLLILCIGVVLSAELINTAIEYTVDLASPEYHVLAGNAKDISAGAVLLASLTAAIIGTLILLPEVWAATNQLLK